MDRVLHQCKFPQRGGMGIDEDPFGNDIMEEGFVEADDIGKYVAMVANLPNGTNVLESTVMPTRQPLVGRG